MKEGREGKAGPERVRREREANDGDGGARG